MIMFEDKVCDFKDIEKKILNDEMDDQDKRFLIEALSGLFFADVGIFVASEKLETLLVNDVYASILGVKGSDLIGKTTTSLAEQGMFEKSVSEMAVKAKMKQTVIQNQYNDKTVLNTAIPVFNDAREICRVVSTIRDMPMLKELYDDLLKKQTLLDGYKQTLKIQSKRNIGQIIAESDKMRDMVRFAEKVAANDSSVLIFGESGVGKGVIADMIHTVGTRSDHHKVSINCGAIPELLLESELFGYSRGAFTGANREGKMGLIEAAEGGTIILDEIGELPMSLQPKLLTFLENGEITKVGSTQSKKVDSRVIAITNQDLKKMVKEGRFREDLYYRLNVIPIEIPPLRERREDITPLILLFLNKCNRKNGWNKTLSPELLEKMQNYYWPGNIRQLRNMIERLVVLSAGNEITINDLSDEELTTMSSPKLPTLHSGEVVWPVQLGKITQEIEEEYMRMAMHEGRSIREAAKLLGISPSMLFRKMNK